MVRLQRRSPVAAEIAQEAIGRLGLGTAVAGIGMLSVGLPANRWASSTARAFRRSSPISSVLNSSLAQFTSSSRVSLSLYWNSGGSCV